jgi:hypothetical protein
MNESVENPEIHFRLRGRNPCKIYADFDDAYRNGKVKTLFGDGQQFDARDEIDLSRPVYDCAEVVDRLSDDATWREAAWCRAGDMAREDKLIPQGGPLSLMWFEHEQVGDNYLWVEYVYTVDCVQLPIPNGNGSVMKGWMAHIFCKFYDVITGRPFHDHPGWCTPRRMFLRPVDTFWEEETEFARGIHFFVAEEDLPEDFRDSARYVNRTLRCVLGVLGTEPEFRNAPPSVIHTINNAKRVRRRLSPLRAVRVFDINRVIFPTQPVGAPSGREMPPHWRRPSVRTLRAARYGPNIGKRIDIPGVNVRADKGGVAPPVYIVKVDD